MTQSLAQARPSTRPSVRFRTAQVQRTQLLTPHMLRVTLGGDSLAGLVTYGNDQHIKLYFERPGVPLPEPFTSETFMALARERRPTLRTYTIRAHRPELAEVDIDFVLHGDSGPASAWAMRAKPGDTLTFAGPVGSYQPPAELDALWLFADETGLPAALAILEGLAPRVRARAFLEVDDARDEQPLEIASDAVDVIWLHRRGLGAGKSQLLLDAARYATLHKAEEMTAAWIACEMSQAKAIRSYLTDERGIPESRMKWGGYWQCGQSEDDAYDEAQRAGGVARRARSS